MKLYVYKVSERWYNNTGRIFEAATLEDLAALYEREGFPIVLWSNDFVRGCPEDAIPTAIFDDYY